MAHLVCDCGHKCIRRLGEVNADGVVPRLGESPAVAGDNLDRGPLFANVRRQVWPKFAQAPLNLSIVGSACACAEPRPFLIAKLSIAAGSTVIPGEIAGEPRPLLIAELAIASSPSAAARLVSDH